MNSFVTLKDVYKRYHMGEVTITASDGVSFEIEKGEFAVVVGSSGAGKTTVLNMLGGMDSCDEGSILVDGEDIAKYTPKQLVQYRRYDIGFVFQFYNLVPNLKTWSWRPRFAKTPWTQNRCCRMWGWGIGSRIFRRSFPAASSSGCLLQERWPSGRS